MSEHTKGPWRIDAGPRSYSISVKGKIICDMRLPQEYGVPIKQVDANAHLIAASPGLLDTCKNALVNLTFLSLPRIDNNVASNKELLKIMKDSFEAEIAKAEPS